jgi:hypothetical protein
MQLALVTHRAGSGAIPAAGPDGTPANLELVDVAATIRGAIAPSSDAADVPSAGGKTDVPPPDSDGTSPEAMQDANHFAERLSDQLTGFVGSLATVDGDQLDVIRLHVDCVRAVLSGRPDLLARETRNLIVDGLGFAIDLVSGKAGGRKN